MPSEPRLIGSSEISMTPAHHAIAVRRNARESRFLGDQNELRVLRRVPQHGRERHRFIAGQYRDHPIWGVAAMATVAWVADSSSNRSIACTMEAGVPA